MKRARLIIGHAWKPLVSLLLRGCASQAPQNTGVKPFPSPPPQAYALLFVYTDRHDALKTYPTLHVDGETVVKLPNDSYSWCYVKPGARIVRALWGDENAGMNYHQNFDFKGGQSLFLRFKTTMSYPFPGVFQIVDGMQPEVAHAQIGNSTYRRPKKDTY